MYRRVAIYLLAVISLTACVDEEDSSPAVSGGKGMIAFGPEVPPLLRGTKTGQDASDVLGGKFYVYGIKNETRQGAGVLKSENLVMRNYKVAYTSGSAYTTLSNKSGWDYAGLTLTDNEAANLSDNSGTGAQTVKYWDPSATDYTFYAVAVGNDDLENGLVKVKKTTNNRTDVYHNGYSVEMEAGADPSQLYFADRVHYITSGSQANSIYSDNVTFTFHNMVSKVRVAMYETIPGYTLTLDAFRVADSATPSFGDMTTAATDAFSANLSTHTPGSEGTLTVTYKDKADNDENLPVADFSSSTKNNILTLGDNLKAGTELTTTSATAIYDHADASYTTVFPMGSNVSNLKLKVDFTLHATTGETIEVKNATAEVPAAYLKWEPGYAYTYIFKISDQTNATIGSLTGLYPVTFDALVVTDGTGEEEEISTTANTGTNIVTMGYDAESQTVVTGQDDYKAGNEVYASFIESNALVNATSSNAKLYVVTTTDADNHPVTESTVADYIIRYAADNTLVDQPVTAYEQTLATSAFVDKVPSTGGGTRTLSAIEWTAAKHVYAVEYTSTAGDKTYKIVRVGGFSGKTTGTLSLGDNTTVSNMGGSLSPLLTVDDKDIDNTEVAYALDYAGTYGQAVPSGVKIENNGTGDVKIVVPSNTAATTGGNTYTVTATYGRRTYQGTFTVSQ